MSASSSTDGSDRHRQLSQQTPPWERQDIPRVPYMGPKSPGLNRADSSPWNTNSSSERRPNAKHSPGSYRQRSLDDGAPTSSNARNDSWETNAPPLTAPPRPIDAPYHTPLWAPSDPSTAPIKHHHVVTARAPPTPPESLGTSSAAASPPFAPAASGLPGTMSSRERTPSRSRARSSKRKDERKHEKSEPTSSFGSRFKSAFKDMFKRDPVNEGDFEHLQNRHWTEEDY